MRVKQFDAVLDDGSDPESPERMRTAAELRLVIGQDSTVRLLVKTPAGVAVDLTTVGTVLLLNVQRTLNFRTRDGFQVTGTLVAKTPGLAEFAIDATAVERVGAGRYYWDAWVEFGGDWYHVLDVGPCVIESALNHP